MTALEIHHLKKVYRNKVPALKGIDLEIKTGDFFGLIGANGAGKSTLVGILTGLVKKTEGKVKILGTDIDEFPEESREGLGVVPQELNFNIFEKIENILINQAGYHGIPRSKGIQRAEELLQLLDLWDKRRQEVRYLSGGMKRRLMLARALVHKPRLLLLDEPTVGIDITARKNTWDYLRQLNREGTTILLTSHNLEEVEQLCHSAAMIHKGQILKSGTIDKLVSSLDRQVYIATLAHMNGLERITGFNISPIDESSLEVILESQNNLATFISALSQAGLSITDIRPKYNRLEQLFFNLHTNFEDENR